MNQQQELQTIPAPSRPKACAVIIRLAAEELGRKIHIDPVAIAKRYKHPMDGYELARKLENIDGWHVDRATMEELDELEHMVDRRVFLTEKVWADENNIQPPFPIGSRVECAIRKKCGVITGILNDDHHVATYEIKADDQDDSKGRARWIVKFEGVLPVLEVLS